MSHEIAVLPPALPPSRYASMLVFRAALDTAGLNQAEFARLVGSRRQNLKPISPISHLRRVASWANGEQEPAGEAMLSLELFDLLTRVLAWAMGKAEPTPELLVALEELGLLPGDA